MHVYRGFSVPVFEDFPVRHFHPLLAEPLFYWLFCNLWPFWNPDFKADFHPPFQSGSHQGIMGG
jgi:hypothetical protein